MNVPGSLRSMLVLAAACLAPLAAPASASSDDTEPAWRIARITLMDGGRRNGRGYILFTRDSEKTGAAFRCEDGKLFAYLSAHPVDFEDYLFRLARRVANREVTLDIGDAEPRTETWVSIFNRRLYLARRISTTSLLFQAAARGDELRITDGDPEGVAIDLPPLPSSSATGFLDSCELDEKHRPILPDKGEPDAVLAGR